MTTSTENAVSHSELSSSIAAALDPITAFSSLKRKRPANIEIPNVLQELKTEKQRDFTPRNGVVCFSEIGVGVSSAKGKKKFMEDAHKIVSCLQGNSNKVSNQFAQTLNWGGFFLFLLFFFFLDFHFSCCVANV
jgi:hypothetical protein